ncbi:NUDIX domain-containing protein [Rheinheimera tilapiae]|uniref:NUDIX domain-containing protein n=1 Tax=Rheinheimera tilapiae TaxID=875043 RepID=A0ABV6BGE9_9GAMM
MPDRSSLHLTVAAVVCHQQRFLLVEERDKITGALVLNQPAGHVEAGEDLFSAVQRELQEETGLILTPTAWLGISQLQAANGHFYYRVNFVFEPVTLPEHYQPQDADILALHWLNADELQQAALPVRSSLVSHAISEYLQGVRLPLDALQPMVRMV